MMNQQIEHLVAISEMPNVEIRVLPLVANHVIVPSSFNYLQFPHIHDVPLNDMVSVETLAGMEYIDGEEEINQYLVAFESLAESALSRKDTRKLISSIANKKRA